MKKFSYKKYADWCDKKGVNTYVWALDCDKQIIDNEGFITAKNVKYWVDSNDWCIETEEQDKPSMEEELFGRTSKKPDEASDTDLIHTVTMALIAAGYEASECVDFLYEILKRGVKHGRY